MMVTINKFPVRKLILFCLILFIFLFDNLLIENVVALEDDETSLGELCPQMLHSVFDQSAPAGDKSSGNFSRRPGIENLVPCVRDCCLLKNDCNVAFIFNGNCYHVKCVSNEACLPKRRKQVLDRSLQMVLVNPVSESDIDNPSWLDILKNSNNEAFISSEIEKFPTVFWKKPHRFRLPSNLQSSDLSYISEEDPQVPNERRINKFMDLNKFPGLAESQFTNSEENGMHNDEIISMDSNIRKFIPCEYGLDNSCGFNEECVSIIPKSREGICNCFEGYKRNKLGQCVQEDLDAEASSVVTNVLANAAASLAENPSLIDPSAIREENHRDIKPDEMNDNNSTATTKNPLKKLVVSVISKKVQLPETEASLVAYTVPDEKSAGEHYKYLWTLMLQPKDAVNGTISDKTKDKVKLSNLSEGVYMFKVTVTGNSSYGETFANVTVLPKNRINKLPQVIITPRDQTIKLPNSKAILDGSTSTDDDKIVSWHWELVEGPIGYQPSLPETSTLQLTDLKYPGNYTFKLTATDSDGAKNYTQASITVLKSTDYPPEANAGTDVIVYLPNNKVILNGNMSTDDREIVAWEWTKDTNDQSKAVDMQNTRTPYLQLSTLEEGMYTFVLKVTDASNQSSTAKVHVFVKQPTNLPPVADAGNNITISLPQNWAILNGSQSKDDIKISNYFWKQILGPNKANILNANSSIGNATGLTIGNYKFELTVSDENKDNATDIKWVKVVQEKNSPPTANAGGDQSITLPVNGIYLNGSKSKDDLEIVNYSWTRDGSSLASGHIVGNTDHKPVMILTDVVPGRYVFKLTVVDEQGLTGSDTVSIIVYPDPYALNLVELTLTMGITVLSQSELDSILQKLVLLIGDVKIHLRQILTDPKSQDAIIIFYVEKIFPDGRLQIVPGIEVEKILKEKFFKDANLLGTSFSDVRTSVCQNKCSYHGYCNTVTRACICETFWMPSLFYFWSLEDANCDWSILYVVVGVFLGFLFLSGMFLGLSCLCRRNKKPRTRAKTQKYALIRNQEEENPYNRNTSLTDSETDSDDVLFENRSKQNGHPKLNGVSRNGPKHPATRLGRRIKT